MQTALEELPATHSTRGVSADTPWVLDKGDLHSRRLAIGEIIDIRVLKGECWITLEGDSTDHVLSSGNGVRLQGPGVVLMESLQAHSSGSIRMQ